MMETSNCQLCISPSFETKCLLFSIKKKLKQLLNDYVPDFNEEDSKEPKNQFSFVQMLKIVFGDKYFSTALDPKCSHEKICRYMKRKFKCDSKTFQQLCDHLALKIGQKNYHFQVLNSQIKTLGETSLKLFSSEETKPKDLMGTSATLDGTCRGKKKESNLVENSNNQFKNIGYQILQSSQGLDLQLQYFYPFGFYYAPLSPNLSQVQRK